MNLRLRVRAAFGALLVAALVLTAGAALAESSPPSSGSSPDASAQPLSPAAIVSIAHKVAASAGDSSPTLIKHVAGTRAQLNLAASGAVVPGDEQSILIIERGHFVTSGVPTPPGAATPKGTVLTAIVDAATGQQTDFGLQEQEPALTGLGPVVTDYAAAAATSVSRGVVRGAIYRGGGPPPKGAAAKRPGVVTVFSRAGRRIARRQVKAGHDFRFALAPGRYLLVAGRSLHAKTGCRPSRAHVRSGRATVANVYAGCRTP